MQGFSEGTAACSIRLLYYRDFFLQPLVAVFKNTTSVQSYQIRFDTDSSSLEIDFSCRDGKDTLHLLLNRPYF